MEEIDLKELFILFWNKRVKIVLIVLIFALIGVIYTTGFVTPVYKSSTSLVLATQENKSTQQESTITATDVTMNSKLVSTYSEIVKSNNIMRKVISNLNLNIGEDALRKSVSVTAVKDTEVISITVTNENASEAAKIANEIAKVFIEKVKDIYNIENVHVLDQAETSNVPSNINHLKDVIVFTFIGVVIAVVYVLIANMLDTTIKTAEEVEREFKIPVLASIPVFDYEFEKKLKGGKRK